MARYYGTIQGRRGEASRLGDRSSGIRASVCSWAGRVETSIQALSGDEDKHIVHIRAETHGSSDNPTGPIFTGTFEELGELIDWWNRRTEINAVLAMLPSAASKPRELPWSDMKAAFDIDDPEALWSQLDQLQFPAGWSLVETDCSGARCVAIFRLSGVANFSDGTKVAQQLARVTGKAK